MVFNLFWRTNDYLKRDYLSYFRIINLYFFIYFIFLFVFIIIYYLNFIILIFFFFNINYFIYTYSKVSNIDLYNRFIYRMSIRMTDS